MSNVIGALVNDLPLHGWIRYKMVPEAYQYRSLHQPIDDKEGTQFWLSYPVSTNTFTRGKGKSQQRPQYLFQRTSGRNRYCIFFDREFSVMVSHGRWWSAMACLANLMSLGEPSSLLAGNPLLVFSVVGDASQSPPFHIAQSVIICNLPMSWISIKQCVVKKSMSNTLCFSVACMSYQRMLELLCWYELVISYLIKAELTRSAFVMDASILTLTTRHSTNATKKAVGESSNNNCRFMLILHALLIVLFCHLKQWQMAESNKAGTLTNYRWYDNRCILSWFRKRDCWS